MSYDASSRTYQIMPNKQVKSQSYVIEISLSDTFTEENIYWFTVRVLQKIKQQQINSKILGSSVDLANLGKISP